MNKMRTFLIVLTAAAALLATMPGQAAQQSVTYVAGQGLRPRNVPDHTGAIGDTVGPVGALGYNFVIPNGKTLKEIQVADAIFGGDSIGLLIWFEKLPDSQFGGCTDPNGKLDISDAVPGAPAGGLVRINVQNIETGELWVGSEPCANLATTGTLTIVYN